MAMSVFVVEIALHQEIVLAGGRVDLRHLLDRDRVVATS